MEKYYFTFGIGQSLLANRYVVIEAENYSAAREIMLESFGAKWCWQYTENEWIENNIANEYGLVKLNINEFWKNVIMEDKTDKIKRRVESYLQQANEYPDLYHVQNYVLKDILKDISSLCENQ